MIYEAAWSEKQVILQNIKVTGIFKIVKENEGLLPHIPRTFQITNK
jgi:hypothetical protein